MADSKISALTELATTPAAGDLLVLVDVSDTTMAASGTDKKITYANLTSALTSGATTFATSSAQTFTNGIVGPTWKPASDSATALLIQDAAAANNIITIDSSNRTVGMGGAASSSTLLTLTQSTTDTGSGFGLNLSKTVTPSGALTGSQRGLNFTLSVTGTSGTSGGNVLAIGGDVFYSQSSGTWGAAAGVDIGVRNTNAGTLTSAYAYASEVRVTGTGSITTAYNFRVKAPTRSSTGVITTLYGYYSANQGLSGTTNSYAVYIEAQSGSTNNYAIYTNGGLVRFGGQVQLVASTTTAASTNVAAGTAPATPVVGDIWNDGALSFYNADATTNAVVNHLRLRRNSTGTAAAGFGLGIIAELESSTTDAQSAGRLTWEWATATHASRAAKGKLTAYYTSTEREVITWEATSATSIVTIAGQILGNNDTDTTHYLGRTAIGYGSGAGSDNAFLSHVDQAASGINYGWLQTAAGESFFNSATTLSLRTADVDRVKISSAGVGIGVSSPQSLIHGHDGSGGFLFVNRATVGGTLVTVIPDAAGDVTEKIFFVGWCTNSAPFSADVAPTTLAVSSSTTKTDGTNTLTIAVTAGGAFTLQATGGAATWNVNLWVFWR